MTYIGQIAVEVAEREAGAGAREIGGNNAGPWVEKYLNANHPGEITHRREMWCCAFWFFCWLEAARACGRTLPIDYTRSTGKFLAQLAVLEQVQLAHGPGGADAFFRARPGDAVFWDYDHDGHPSHVNMLHHIDESGAIYTIGGNEGDEDSGAPVRIKRRGLLHELPSLLCFGLMFPGDEYAQD